MNKYFTKEESENIITLLTSKDIESIKFGFSLLEAHPKFKYMKKLIPYNEKRINFRHGSRKNNLVQEIRTLRWFITRDWFITRNYFVDDYIRESRHLIKFIRKRTK